MILHCLNEPFERTENWYILFFLVELSTSKQPPYMFTINHNNQLLPFNVIYIFQENDLILCTHHSVILFSFSFISSTVQCVAEKTQCYLPRFSMKALCFLMLFIYSCTVIFKSMCFVILCLWLRVF